MEIELTTVVKFRELELDYKVISPTLYPSIGMMDEKVVSYLSHHPSILMGIMDAKLVSYQPTIHPSFGMMDEKVVSYPPSIHPSWVRWMNK